MLADFPDDDPASSPIRAGGRRYRLPPRCRPTASPLADALLAELRALAPAYARSCTERLRSTVGLSGLSPAECGEYVAAWLRGERPASPVEDMSPILCLRFAIDDLKAYALEAAIGGGSHPSSQQLGDWLWNDSAVGAATRTLRAASWQATTSAPN